MLTKRIVPCLDIQDGRVVKGIRFEDIVEVDDPVSLAKYYNSSGADELVFYDIRASYENRILFTDLLKRVSAEVTIPLTAGGGISTIEDFDRVLEAGADKVSVNSGAVKNPDLISEAAKKFGSRRVILAIDAARVGDKFHAFVRGGREDSGMDITVWAKEMQDRGAGEIVLNSIDNDGVKKGFDIDMLAAVSNAVKIPIIASGGAGCMEDFLDLFNKVPDIDCGLAASIFHRKEVEISALKQYLLKNGINVRT